MIVAVVLGAASAALLCIEALRWTLRPEARRLRAIKKIGGRR